MAALATVPIASTWWEDELDDRPHHTPPRPQLAPPLPAQPRKARGRVSESLEPRNPLPIDASECTAHAWGQCGQCHGRGRIINKRWKQKVCNCVWRAMFRKCVNKYLYVQQFPGEPRYNGRFWQRSKEDWCADFLYSTRKALTPEQFQLFRLYYLQQMEWRAVMRKLRMTDRGEFFHEVFRVAVFAGRRCRLEEPYSVLPFDLYFGSRKPNAQPE